MTNSLLNEMEADAQAPAADSTEGLKLKRLVPLVQAMQDAEAQVEAAEKALSEAKATLALVSEKQIPDLFAELGIEEIKVDGHKVVVQRGYAATLTKKNQPTAFKWLRDNGHGELIKHVLAIALKKGEEESHEKITAALKELGVTYADAESVHPSTLKAFVNEQMSKPESRLPQDIFKVFPLSVTKIK